MLTIIIPTFNEAENLQKLTDQLLKLDFQDLNILVVDDNSPDGTGDVAEELKNKYPRRIAVLHRKYKMGLGTAYKSGFLYALEHDADIILQMDADFSHPVKKITEMVGAIEDCDCVIGSRYVDGGSLDERWPLWRKGLSAFGNNYAKIILKLPIKDITGGFRLWRSETLQFFPFNRIKSNGYAFQVEMAFVGHCLGCNFIEIPIYFADRKWGKSKMSLKVQIEAALRVWYMLFQYKDLIR